MKNNEIRCQHTEYEKETNTKAIKKNLNIYALE